MIIMPVAITDAKKSSNQTSSYGRTSSFYSGIRVALFAALVYAVTQRLPSSSDATIPKTTVKVLMER